MNCSDWSVLAGIRETVEEGAAGTCAPGCRWCVGVYARWRCRRVFGNLHVRGCEAAQELKVLAMASELESERDNSCKENKTSGEEERRKGAHRDVPAVVDQHQEDRRRRRRGGV